MAEMGIGYGSEFHLLRMLGRHRAQFDATILGQLSADGVKMPDRIEWLDSPFNPKHKTKDGEWKSVDFVPDHGGERWKEYWPDRRIGKDNREGVPSWDAVGKLHLGSQSEWLLVEAKAHEAEFASVQAKCGAGGQSLKTITRSLKETFLYCGGDDGNWSQVENMWLGRGYQLANRLACLRFLLQASHPARLVYVHFIGDTYKVCPSNKARWRDVIEAAYCNMGLPKQHRLSDRIHYVFPHVAKKCP